MNKIKERARRRAALTDRKSAAAQARMKNIANLAADERVPKKRRKASGGTWNPFPESQSKLDLALIRGYLRSGRR